MRFAPCALDFVLLTAILTQSHSITFSRRGKSRSVTSELSKLLLDRERNNFGGITRLITRVIACQN